MRDVRIYRSLIRFLDTFAQFLARFFLTTGEYLGIVKYSADMTKVRSFRSQVVWEEARSRGILMRQVTIFGMPAEAYRAKMLGMWHYFISLPFPPHVSTTRLWFDDKYLLKKHLKLHGIPTPRSHVASTVRHARRLFRTLPTPFVVKPRFGSRGRHTTTQIADEANFVKAFRLARKLCVSVSIEEELVGNVCRGTVVGGVLVGFLEAQTAYVEGNGTHTVIQLIKEKNLSRPEQVSEVDVTLEVKNFLERSGLTLSSVPRKGEKIALTHRTGRLFGGETRELLATVHPRLRRILEEAARILDVSIVGFDLIIRDPESDPDMQQWGIIEANTLPFIDLHYLPLHGTPSPTAKAVWDLWKTPT